MASGDSNRDLLPLLASHEWRSVREALSVLEHRLRNGVVADRELDEVGETLVALAAHTKWEVRKALADTVLHLRHSAFDVTIARLLEDENSFVKDAAKRTLARRSEIATADTLSEEHGDMMRRWLADLEARHGARARVAALRVAQQFAGVAMREAQHELVKVIAPLDLSLAGLSAELEKDDPDRESLRRLLGRARRRTELLTLVVSSLSEFYSEVTPHFEGENLRSLVDEACSLVVDHLAERFGEITTSVDIPASLRLQAHRHRLVQALTNILKNGVEAYDGVDRPINILIEAKLDRDHVVIECTDHGSGMSAEACRDAFQLFSTGKRGGTGFGLPLAKKVVESEHRGSITVVSEEGVGTTIRISLPLEQDAGRV